MIFMGELIDKLSKIYSRIPDFKCREGCGECCGPIPHFTEGTIFDLSNIGHVEIEKEAIKEYLRLTGKKYKTVTVVEESCPYLIEDKKCEIYPVRPLVCRLFGVMPEAEELRCPYIKPERTISYKKLEKIVRQIESLRKLIQKKSHPSQILQSSQNLQSL